MKSASSHHSNDSMNMKKKKKKNRNKNKSVDLSMEAGSEKSSDSKRVIVDITNINDENCKSEESK